MRITSFDVGIKNLAMCIIDVVKQNKKTCSSDGCSLTACKKNSDNVYCTRHSKGKQNITVIPKKEMPNNIIIKKWEIINLAEEEMNINLSRKCSVDNCKTKPTKQTLGRNKTFYCTKHSKKLTEETESMKNKVLVHDLALYGKRMQNYFEKNKEILLSSDLIVIENQPVLTSPTFKSYQMIIYSWFLFQDKKVSLVSANSKLKVYTGNDKEELDKQANTNKKGGKRTDYATRKNQGILHARAMLKNDSSSLKFLDDHPTKIDDLCDSFLLGCYGSML